MNDARRFPVIEIFGPTIQGEGNMAGLPSHFVRFGGCDFKCHWCDSAHAVLPENVRGARRLSAATIATEVMSLSPKAWPAEWVTLSGGNPALHDLGELVSRLHSVEYKVAVETQGSIWKEWLGTVDMLTVSPKPPSSKMKNEYLPTFMQKAFIAGMNMGEAPKMCLKVPVYDEEDLDFAIAVHDEWPHVNFFVSIVTEMGGLYGDFADGRVDTANSLLARYQRVAQDVLRRGVPDVRVIPQLHYLIWGNVIGR